jgi:photosystem II stability/assembly factor-like uncharacterized protein
MAATAQPTWRVGRHGSIQKREANGKWNKQDSGVKAHLYDISFSSPATGWVVGQAGTVLRTTDGGATWTQLAKPTTEDLVHVTAASDQAAIVKTRSGQTLSTTDSGQTWKSE